MSDAEAQAKLSIKREQEPSDSDDPQRNEKNPFPRDSSVDAIASKTN